MQSSWTIRHSGQPIVLRGRHLGEAGREFGLTIRRGVLVEQCGLGRRVAETVHQLAHRGAGLGGHGGAGVTEVVEA